MTKKIKLDPKCFDRRQEAFGYTNRGELLPCCWADTSVNRVDEDYNKLLSVSKIDEHENINEITLKPEWINFYKNLKNNKGFPACFTVCKKRKSPQHKRETWYVKGQKTHTKES